MADLPGATSHEALNVLLFSNTDVTGRQLNDEILSPSPPVYAFDLVAYMIVGVLGALVWDVFSNLGEDYQLIRMFPIGLPVIIYFLSRISTLLTFSLMVRFSTATNADCTTLLRAILWTFVFGISLTSLLFVLRARAVYTNRKWVANVLSVMWLGVVAASVVETQTGSLAMRQEPSGRCFAVHTNTPLIIATTIVPMANDIVLFCAITWRLVQNCPEEITMKKGITVAVFGNGLQSFSRTLLRDGQVYFLTTVIASIIAIGIFCFAPQTVAGYSILLAFLNIGVMHLMASKIYRKTRLGLDRLDNFVKKSESSLGPMEFRPRLDSSFTYNTDEDNLRSDPRFPPHLVL